MSGNAAVFAAIVPRKLNELLTWNVSVIPRVSLLLRRWRKLLRVLLRVLFLPSSHLETRDLNRKIQDASTLRGRSKMEKTWWEMSCWSDFV